MSREQPDSPRRRPKQERSREIVRAIREAGLRILEQEGPKALTTNHIARVAGVSIGSLYRYYPNKEAIVADVYEAHTQNELTVFSDVDRWADALSKRPLRDAIRAIVKVAVDRERKLLELDPNFYRDHNLEFALGKRVGQPLIQGIQKLLEHKRDALRIDNLDYASFLVARGLGGILRVSLDERPENLADPAFVDELTDLFVRYLEKEPEKSPSP